VKTRLMAATAVAIATCLSTVAGAAPNTVSSPAGGVGPTTVSTALASWTGPINEVFVKYGLEQQPSYHVHSSVTAGCNDVFGETIGNHCTATVDAWFLLAAPQTVNGHKIYLCLPDEEPDGFNAFVTFTSSTGASFSEGGTAYMSTSYTEDQPLPQKAPAHFHFETHQAGTADGSAADFSGTAVGLRACAASSGTVAGYMTAAQA